MTRSSYGWGRNSLVPFSTTPTTTTSPPTISNTLLGYRSCYLLDIPDDTRQQSSRAYVLSPQEGETYSCFFKTKYLTGERWGPCVCVFLCVLISIIGVFGMAANIVNVLVLKHSTKGSSLQKLLIILAGFDLLACFFAFLTAVVLQVILDDVNKCKGILIALKVTFLCYSLGRTGANYITILVAVERYLVVVHNFNAKSWANSRRLLVILLLWLFMIWLINLPWWLNSVVVSQNIGKFAKGPLAKYPSIFVATTFASRYYNGTWLYRVHTFVDFVLPLPVLLIFNGLLYRFIYKWTKKRRQSMTGAHVREVNAAKMFSIVVVMLFVCHSFAVIDFFVTQSLGTVYRELHLSIMLAVALNAASNFLVYYTFGQDFKEYFWLLIGSKVIKNSNRNTNGLSPGEAMFGRVSPGAEIVHENVKYTKSHAAMEDPGEQCRLLEVPTFRNNLD